MLKIIAAGKLGKDAEVRAVGNSNVISFSIPHTEKWKDKQGNQQERTQWLDCSLWRESTAIAQYLTKGTSVVIEGTPEARAYAGKDGSPAASLSVKVMNLELLGGGNRQDNAQSNIAPPPQAQPAVYDGSDLPF